jgi:ubiquinone/menaquinone biosynthesis C-methylase UbiE
MLKMDKDFHHESYKLHKKHYEEGFNKELLNAWKDKDTIDYWRHERMYKNLLPIIEAYKEASWLTIGDGRYGTDANYLISSGVKEVLATDISDYYLKIAKDDGFITNYQIENAEQLSFKDHSFDFVLCKEAYHHFPRPMIALYEMLRVAKKAVILIEPLDENTITPSKLLYGGVIKWGFQFIKNQIKLLFGKKPYYFFGNYEVAGNYVYTLSEREIEKVGLGLNLNYVAFNYLNDYYIEGLEWEKVNDNSDIFKNIKKKLAINNKSSAKGFLKYGMIIAIIFKSDPSEKCINLLNSHSYSISKLSKNPFLQK